MIYVKDDWPIISASRGKKLLRYRKNLYRFFLYVQWYFIICIIFSAFEVLQSTLNISLKHFLCHFHVWKCWNLCICMYTAYLIAFSRMYLLLFVKSVLLCLETIRGSPSISFLSFTWNPSLFQGSKLREVKLPESLTRVSVWVFVWLYPYIYVSVCAIVWTNLHGCTCSFMLVPVIVSVRLYVHLCMLTWHRCVRGLMNILYIRVSLSKTSCIVRMSLITRNIFSNIVVAYRKENKRVKHHSADWRR